MDILLAIIGVAAVVLVVWCAISAIFMRLRRPAFAGFYQHEMGVFGKFRLPEWVDPAKYERSALTTDDGVALALYVLEGPPNSPVVVFMPGTAAYAEIYSDYLFSLHRRGFTVIGYDPRGHGESERLRGYFDLPLLIADARRVCAYAKGRFGTKVGFSGSSQGGIVAFYLAATGDPNVDTVMCHNIAWCDGDTILQISRFKPPKFLVPVLIRLFRLLHWFVVPVTFYLPFGKLQLPDGKPAEGLLKADPMTTLAYSLGAVASLAKTDLAVPPNRIKTPLMLLSSVEDEVFPVAYEQALFDQLTCPKQFVCIGREPPRWPFHLMFVFFAHEQWLMDPIADWFNRHLH